MYILMQCDKPFASLETMSPKMRECLTADCKAFSLANAKEKGNDGLVIRSLDD